MSCVRDTSPTTGSKNAQDTGKQESKKRRFHPFRGLRRIFRRKARAHEHGPSNPDSPHSSREGLSPEEPSRESAGIEAQCSRSASQLIQDPSHARRSLHSTVLSVSHDSIFSPDIHPESQLGSVLSVQKLGHSNIRAELFDAVRRRKGREDTSEEDLGLPHSPLSNSLNTTDALSDANKDIRITKSSHSTCSDGSLLSMGSSEMDDDFYGHHGSRNSSKLSLYDRKSLNQDSDTGVDLNASVTSTQLSHSAARHKMAIKPKRTHGAPRRNKQFAVGSILPSTPELNEDANSRSLSSQTSDSVSTIALATPSETPSDVRVKSASLPSGLSPISTSSVKLTRSRSNAAYLSTNDICEEEEDSEMLNRAKRDESNSFFGRLLSRRSGKKKKAFTDDCLTGIVLPKRMDDKGRYTHEISNVSVKHFPAARQRVDPINIPSDCNPIVSRMHISYPHFPPTLSDLEGGVVVHSVPVDKVEVVHTKPVVYDLPDVLRPVKKSFSFRCPDRSYTSDSLSLPVTINSVKDDMDCPSSDAVENKLGVRNVSITEEMVPVMLLSRSNENDSSLSSSSSEVTELTSDSHTVVISADKPEIKTSNNVKSIEISSSPNVESFEAKSSHNQVSTVILSESPETIKSEKEFYNVTKIKKCANIIIPDPASPDYLSKSPKFLSSYAPKSPKMPTPDSPPEDFRKFLEEVPPISPRSIDTISKSPKVPEPVLPPIPAPRTSILKKEPENQVPEFMKIQLNRIENKSTSHVILSTSPEKSECHEKVVKTDKLESREIKKEVSDGEKNVEYIDETEKPEVKIFDKNANLAKLDKKPENTESLKPELKKLETDSELSHADKPVIMEAIHKPNIAPKSPLSYAPHKFTINTRQWSSVNSNNNKTSVSHTSEVTANQIREDAKPFDMALNKPIFPSIKHTSEVTTNQRDERKPFDQLVAKPVLSPIKHTSEVTTNQSKDNGKQFDETVNKPVGSSIRQISEITTNQSKDDRKSFDQTVTKPVLSSSIKLSSEVSTNQREDRNHDEIANKPFLSSSIKVILRSHSSIEEDSLKFCDIPVRSNSTENLSETIIVCNDSKPFIKSDTSKSKTLEKLDNSKTEKALNAVSDKSNEHSCLKPEGCPNVVLRRKSDVKDLRSSKDDEPELLKVFARRSLKIKDSDIVESVKLVDNRESTAKSRDSDKENEEMDSPPEERKFKELIKSDIDNEVSSKPVFNFISNVNFTKPDSPYSLLNTYSHAKYQRSLSHNADDLSNTILLLSNQRENNINNNIFEKRQRSKTLPDLQVQKNVSNTLFLNENDNNNITGEKPETTQKFKRIQQRAEEWERRAQLAMKKTSVE